MASPIHVPRVNNNDDEVKLVGLNVEPGSRIEKGQVVAQVETDKAVVDVESTAAGFVLAVQGELEQVLQVGSVLLWVGKTADEPIPDAGAEASGGSPAEEGAAPTARARILLAEYGLQAADVPCSGARLSAADVEAHVARAGLARRSPVATKAAAAPDSAPAEPGARLALSGEEKGMLATVLWHRDVAVPGYVEVRYDAAPWDELARDYGARHKLLLNPLLPLLAWRVVELAVETPRLNATLVGRERHEYRDVNLGFTVQAGATLYLTVARDAGRKTPLAFVQDLIDLQRRAAAHKLAPEETQGATIAFSSMARWKVERHMPILPPHTAIMVAHTVGADGAGVLGASYDHRVLNGSEVAAFLRKLCTPPRLDQST